MYYYAVFHLLGFNSKFSRSFASDLYTTKSNSLTIFPPDAFYAVGFNTAVMCLFLASDQ